MGHSARVPPQPEDLASFLDDLRDPSMALFDECDALREVCCWDSRMPARGT